MSMSKDNDEFQLDEFLPYRLSVASENVSRLLVRRYLGEMGLGLPEWRLLAAIGRHGMLSPTTSGRYTAMDKVKTSRATARLIALGLVNGTADPQDGRGRQLRLTRKGQRVYAAMPKVAEEMETMILGNLSRTEARQLQTILRKLITHTKSVMAD
jgi:DNA-binding MarR family transcriptional regulator